MQKVTKGQRKKKRALVGYDEQPPLCKSCIYYEFGIKFKDTCYQMRCTKHKFGVNPSAICDYWKNKSGETIE